MSTKELTRAEESLLSTGLNFSPVPSNVNNFQLDEDLDQFTRSLRLKDLFYNWGKKHLEEARLTDSDTGDNEKTRPSQNLGRKVLGNHQNKKKKTENLESSLTS